MTDSIRVKLADGWRLPTKNELASLLWDDKAAKAAYLEKFGSKNHNKYLANWFWSSSADAGNSDGAWSVSFSSGGVYYYYKDFDGGQVRLVRGRQCLGSWREGDAPETRYEVSECGTIVTDHKTGLEWQREPEVGKFTWQQAIYLFADGKPGEPV